MKQSTLSSCARVNLVVKSKMAIKILRATPFNALLYKLNNMFTTPFCKRRPLENVHCRVSGSRSGNISTCSLLQFPVFESYNQIIFQIMNEISTYCDATTEALRFEGIENVFK